jgi:hypothetical protein
MRKNKIRSLLITLIVIFALMLIVNLIVLRAYFDVSISDLLPSSGDGSVKSDSSAYGDRSDGRDRSADGDGTADRGSPSIGDSPAAGEISDGSDHSFSGLPDPDDVEDLIKGLSLRDKITLAYIMSKIGRDELDRLYDISQDGITADEIAALREYALERLDPSDIEALEEIFYRNMHLYSDSQLGD